MTNQEYITAIENRTSRRTFRPRLPDEETRAVLKELVDIINNKQEGAQFIFIDDCSSASKTLSGKFCAIAVCGDDSEKTRISCGYWGESIVLQCVHHGLGTCWVTGTYDENKVLSIIKIPKTTRLYGIIAIGYVKDKLSLKEKTLYNMAHNQNKPYQKMFEVSDAKLPEEYAYAMKLVEKAPSDANRRAIHFKYENGIISAYVDEPYSDKSIEFGIAQLHFNLGAKAKGITGKWNIQGKFIPDDNKVIKFPENDMQDE